MANIEYEINKKKNLPFDSTEYFDSFPNETLPSTSCALTSFTEFNTQTSESLITRQCLTPQFASILLNDLPILKSSNTINVDNKNQSYFCQLSVNIFF